MGFDWIVLGNPLNDWFSAAVMAITFTVAVTGIKRLFRHRFAALAAGKANGYADLAAELIHRIHPLVTMLLAVYFGAFVLTLPPLANRILNVVVGMAVLIQVGVLTSRLINFYVEQYKRSKIETNADAATTISSGAVILRFIIWMVLLLVALDNLGINITTLIAGLGIGGIAVALATQNILGDLFASLSIVLDKPFVVGDFIIVNDYLGSVERIGLKTTRIRSLSGEQLIFSNTDLLNSRIRNFKRMYERRVVFAIGVLYQTEYEKLSRIPDMIRNIIERREPVRFDRAHFKEFSDYALKFEVVYWIQTPDYNVYMDIQQAINLEIHKQFEEAQIGFAYPTQTVFIESRSE